MALETVIYPQESFGYGCKEYYIPANLSNYNYELGLLQGGEEMTFTSLLDTGNNNRESSSSPVMYNNNTKEYSSWDPNYSSIEDSPNVNQLFMEASPAMMEPPPAARAATVSGRRKRRRTRSCKNKEELENQRMTHIAVERNRRKQMNEYLAVIRSLMPPSYVQRGDQASIIGGAINFVKELEHHLQTLEAQKITHSQQQQQQSDCHGLLSTPLFADYFSFPQYSTRSNHSNSSTPADAAAATTCDSPLAVEKQLALAEIEVTMAESHANLKILSKRRPKQLLKMVAGLQCLWLTVLHLNVTTVDHMVLYSLSLKLEEGCQLTTADEIADAVNQLLGRVQEEAASSYNNK